MQGLTSFFWDYDNNKVFILYGKGSLFRHNPSSAALINRWTREYPGSEFPVKHILQYTFYKKSVEATKEVAVIETTAIYSYKSFGTIEIEKLNKTEIDSYMYNMLPEILTSYTSIANQIPNGLTEKGYNSMTCIRRPIEGNI